MLETRCHREYALLAKALPGLMHVVACKLALVPESLACFESVADGSDASNSSWHAASKVHTLGRTSTSSRCAERVEARAI